MPVSIGVGFCADPDPRAAFDDAARQASASLTGECDLAILFAGGSHIAEAGGMLDVVHEQLAPRNLIGCGAGGVVVTGREIESGDGAVVWALSAPEAALATHHLVAEREDDEPDAAVSIAGLPEEPERAEAMIVLADPYTFPAEALLARLNSERPGLPVLGGLASAGAPGSTNLLRDHDTVAFGAVAVTLRGLPVLPCVSQGAEPLGAEMTITACEGNVIAELASMPAIERLREVIGELGERERRLAGSGLLLGIVIDENQPEYVRGDFLVRPIIGADESSGSIAVGERVRVGQTVRIHVRDPQCADEDLRAALRLQSAALHDDGAAGVLLFTCNGRGERMFGVPDHDAAAVEDAFGAPTGGFFCAGEIGPVGGRNFLHGFTATIAVFPCS